jgi:hypothetical protein
VYRNDEFDIDEMHLIKKILPLPVPGVLKKQD